VVVVSEGRSGGIVFKAYLPTLCALLRSSASLADVSYSAPAWLQLHAHRSAHGIMIAQAEYAVAVGASGGDFMGRWQAVPEDRMHKLPRSFGFSGHPSGLQLRVISKVRAASPCPA
jgi:hypothetical protein